MPNFKYGFQDEFVTARTRDGRNFDLLDYLTFYDRHGNLFRTKTSTDGVSTPRLLWFLIPPFGLRIWKPGVLHDGAYRNRLEYFNFNDQVWTAIALDEDGCNELIFDAMRSCGASRLERFVIYIALQWFGWRAFDEDRRIRSKVMVLPAVKDDLEDPLRIS